MRKAKHVTITADGRDKGKVFYIEEMSCVQAEKWAVRTILALGRSGVTIPDGVGRAGMAGIAIMGLQALFRLQFDLEVEGLFDEMFQCVKIVRDKKHMDVVQPLLIDDIEEVSTRILLRLEVLELHVGFSIAELREGLSTSATTSPVSNDTQTASQHSSLQ